LEGDIGREAPTSRSSPDLRSATEDGGSGHSENDAATLGDHQQGGTNSSETPGETPDSVPALTAASLSVLSTRNIPLPTRGSNLIDDSTSLTGSSDENYQGNTPREQQTPLDEQPRTDLEGRHSNESLEETPIRRRGALWIHSVPPEIIRSVSDQERRRQEAIHKLIYTERKFVRAMELLRERWIKPLLTTNIIPEGRRTRFVQSLFWNLDEIVGVHTRLRDALDERQKSDAIVPVIGDIHSNIVQYFECLVEYGGRQLVGRFEFEKEKRSNPTFEQFVAETEGMPESRNLGLNDYLTKPKAHLVRYASLLGLVLKHTPDDNPDKLELMEVTKVIDELLRPFFQEDRKMEARITLLELEQQLVFSQGEQVDLRLRDNNRELLCRGTLKRQGRQGDNFDLQVFLFDHALLMVKANRELQQLNVYKRPIPLEFLVVEAQEESTDQDTLTVARESDSRKEYPITFTYLGRNGYVLKLWASTLELPGKLSKAIAQQQERIREMDVTFKPLSLTARFFNSRNKVNCAAPFAAGHQIAYGTGRGVYISDVRHREGTPEHVLDFERSVITIPLNALDARNPKAGLKRAKTISSDASFFKLGTCLGRTLLCVVNARAASSTIKVLEPIGQTTRSKRKMIFKKLLPGRNDTLKVFKVGLEFDIPIRACSIYFLKTQLCVGYAEGRQIIDLETLDMAPLLDTADRSLDLVQPGVRVDNTPPTATYLIKNEFLLCYNEYAFYLFWRVEVFLNQLGTFIEVHDVDTGQLVQIIPGKDLHCLFADNPPLIEESPTNSETQLVELRPDFFIAGLSEQSPYTRDEIIIVSDGNVMTVELAPLLLRQRLASSQET
ncbi:RHO1 GDP-GTP exchange protein 2, partial [Tulasnella sp. 417]